jgi:hypothetical protein
MFLLALKDTPQHPIGDRQRQANYRSTQYLQVSIQNLRLSRQLVFSCWFARKVRTHVYCRH